MIFRNEITVHKGIIPESSGFHSGTVEDYVLPKRDAASEVPGSAKSWPLKTKALCTFGTRSYGLYSEVTPQRRRAEYGFLYLSFRASQVYNIQYNKPTRNISGSIVFIKNYKYALHVSDALCVHLQEHYKL